MSAADYYPAGAYNDPNAPYNQSDPKPIDVEVVVSYSLSKTTTVSTKDYIVEEWEDWETGDEGEVIHSGGIDYNFSDSDLKSAYLEEITLENIIKECLRYAEDDLENYPNGSGRGAYIKRLIEACKGWNIDELEVVKE